MLQFFKKIRRQLLTKGKFRKYLIYAIGEIVLIVLGILIAVQIGNSNEKRKTNKQLHTYRKNLIVELDNNIARLASIDSMNAVYRKAINDYIDYYNLSNSNLDTLHFKRKLADRYSIISFQSTSFTIEQLLSTGNISIFSEEEKNRIKNLNSTIEITRYYERKIIDLWAEARNAYLNEIDILEERGLTQKGKQKTQNWHNDINSEQYRLFHNQLAQALTLYDYQKLGNEDIRVASLGFKKLLEEKIED